jgi:purine-binding chemotaxis protein CheW
MNQTHDNHAELTDEALFLHFIVNNKHYAMPVDNLREILPPAPLTPLPDAPPELIGSLDVRGQMILIFDLMFYLEHKNTKEIKNIIIIENNERRYGLVIGPTLCVTPHAYDEIQPPPPELNKGLIRGTLRYQDNTVFVITTPDQENKNQKTQKKEEENTEKVDLQEQSAWLSFYLDNVRLGLPLMTIFEVIEATHLTPVPLSDAMILGVLNLRGNIIPVVDLSAQLGLHSHERSRHIIMAEQLVGAARAVVGFAVSRVDVVVDVEEEVSLPPTFLGALSSSPHVRAIAPQHDMDILLLNIENLFEQELTSP